MSHEAIIYLPNKYCGISETISSGAKPLAYTWKLLTAVVGLHLVKFIPRVCVTSFN
jgi:hypothetical protein